MAGLMALPLFTRLIDKLKRTLIACLFPLLVSHSSTNLPKAEISCLLSIGHISIPQELYFVGSLKLLLSQHSSMKLFKDSNSFSPVK